MCFFAILRSLVIALVVLGMSASAMAYAMPNAMGETVMAAGPGQDAGAPCGMIAPMHDAVGKARNGEMPCNSITPDCVKMMVCLQTAALPEHRSPEVGPVTFVMVTYRVSISLRTGMTPEPELSPPLAA